MGLCDSCCKKKRNLFKGYVASIAYRPCTWLASYILLFLLVVILGGLLMDFPKLETDLSSGGYLRSDGVVADRYDALKAAQALESKRTESSGVRRLYGATSDRSAGVAASNWLNTSVDDEQLSIEEILEEDAMLTSEAAHADGVRRLDGQVERLYAEWKVDLFYEADYIFAPQVLTEIRNLENKIASLPSYSKFCLIASRQDRSCRFPISAMRFFHGRSRQMKLIGTGGGYETFVDRYIYPDGKQIERNPIGSVINAVGATKRWRTLEGSHARLWYFDANFPQSRLMRSRFWFGAPIKGFKSRFSNFDEQESRFREFLADELFPVLLEASTDKVKVFYEGDVVTDLEVQRGVIHDSLFALLSLFLVYLFMAFYTRAPLLSLFGMITIGLSVPLGFVLFGILGHSTFPVINLLAEFLIIGIGADHIFVLTDTWRQTKYETKDVEKRLRITLSRAGKAITACGTTTAVSFFANVFSAVRPVRWFGVFVGLCVISNLALCLCIFPIMLVLREKLKPWWKESCPDCCNKCNCCSPSDFSADANPSGANPTTVVNVGGATPGASPEMAEYEIKCHSRTERILVQRYAPCLLKCRLVVVILSLIVTFGGLALLTQRLEVSKEPPAFFGEGENMYDVQKKREMFGNESKWASDMEWEPLRLCKGCTYSQAPEFAPANCERLGANCQDVPCNQDPFPCSGRGTCREDGLDGRCTCIPGWTGASCAEAKSASVDDCGAAPDELPCSGHGTCHRGFCWCQPGWTFEKCEARDPAIQDCQWTVWTGWSDCSAQCGIGQIQRTREHRTPAGVHGLACSGNSLQTDSCQKEECSVDCVLSVWSEWGSCSEDCGDGLKKRTRFIATEARNQGKSCEGDVEEFELCSMPACGPVCDVSAWVQSGSCSKSCGGGTILEKRTVTVNSGDGSECPTEVERTVLCNQEKCPCTYSSSWEDTSDCSVTCGDGTKSQKAVKTSGDSTCAEEQTRTVACRQSICKVEPPNCNKASSYGEWSEWSLCSAVCGPSERERTRTSIHSVCDQTREAEICTTNPCPKACSEYQWVLKSDCDAVCGKGKKTERREFNGDTPPEGCPTERQVDCAAGVECPVDCELGTWQQTTPCSTTCGRGSFTESRPVLRFGEHGGKACPAEDSTERSRTSVCDDPCPGEVPTTTTKTTTSPTTPPADAAPEPADEDATTTTRMTTTTRSRMWMLFTVYLGGIFDTLSTQEESLLITKIANAMSLESASVEAYSQSLEGTGATPAGSRRLDSHLVVNMRADMEGRTPEAQKIFESRLEDAVKDGSLARGLIDGGMTALDALWLVDRSGRTIRELPPSPTMRPIVTVTESPFVSGGSAVQPDPGSEAGNTIVIQETQSEAKKLPNSEVATVNLVFGLKELPPSKGSDGGDPVYDTDFDFGKVEAQAAYMELRRDTLVNPALDVRGDRSLLDDFNVFLDTQQRAPGFPTNPGSDVHGHLNEFIESYFGKDYKNHAGFDESGLVTRWIMLSFKTNLPNKMPATDATEWMERWDKYTQDCNSKFKGKGLGHIYHSSDLWVRAETEMRLVNSTLICACFSVVFALLLVMLFLWNLALAVYLVLGIVCVVICLATCMFGILGWSFGAVEAVGLIVFVGFSVDYSLHMVESFNMSRHNTRYAKVQDAMRRTGGAVLAAGTTSMLAGLPILICTIKAFVKFGATIVLNTALSLFWSMVFLCALLMLIGPVDNFGSCDVICGSCGGDDEEEKEDTSIVPGHVMGIGGAGSTPTTMGGAPTEYRWDTGEDSKDEDLKKGGKGAKGQTESTEAETTTQENPATTGDIEGTGPAALSDETEMESPADNEPPRSPPSTVTAPTRESPRAADPTPQTLGRHDEEGLQAL